MGHVQLSQTHWSSNVATNWQWFSRCCRQLQLSLQFTGDSNGICIEIIKRCQAGQLWRVADFIIPMFVELNLRLSRWEVNQLLESKYSVSRIGYCWEVPFGLCWFRKWNPPFSVVVCIVLLVWLLPCQYDEDQQQFWCTQTCSHFEKTSMCLLLIQLVQKQNIDQYL